MKVNVYAFVFLFYFAGTSVGANEMIDGTLSLGPVIEPARSGVCVEPPDVMRRNHFEYLKHQRDETVHGGIRGAKYSLKTCINCHASSVTNSVAVAKENFCVSCHNYVAVKIDCFECHSSRVVSQGQNFLPLDHFSKKGTWIREIIKRQTSSLHGSQGEWFYERATN